MSWFKGSGDKPLSLIDKMGAEEYLYTVGIAGEEFVKGIQAGKIIGSKCPRCGMTYVPPRLYCEECFCKTEFVEVGSAPYIDTYTVIYRDDKGNKVDPPQKIAMVRFEGVKGGLLAIVEGEVKIGKKVRILRYQIPLIVE